MIAISSPHIEVEPPERWHVDEALEALFAAAEPNPGNGFVSNVVVLCDRIRSDVALEEYAAANLAELGAIAQSVTVRQSNVGDGFLDRVLVIERDGLSVVQYQRLLLYPSGVTNKVHWLVQIQASCPQANEGAYAPTFGRFVTNVKVTPATPE